MFSKFFFTFIFIYWKHIYVQFIKYAFISLLLFHLYIFYFILLLLTFYKFEIVDKIRIMKERRIASCDMDITSLARRKPVRWRSDIRSEDRSVSLPASTITKISNEKKEI